MPRRPRPEIPSPTALVDDVHRRLWGRLVDQQIPPGQRLVVGKLADELGVSPTPVREALGRLEAEALVIRRPMSGWSSAPLLDFRRFGELFEMRQLLEPEAARRAAASATPAQLADLGELAASMSRYSGGEYFEDVHALIDVDRRFHHHVAEASDNHMLAEAVARLHAHAHLYRLYRKSGIVSNTAVEHTRILDAIARRDSQAAGEEMDKHIRRSHARLAPWLTTVRPSSGPS